MFFENLDKFLMLSQLFQMFLPESKDKSVDEFKKWLEMHNHNQMVEILNNENQIASYLSSLITDKNEDLKNHLDEIKQMFASILANTKAFAPLASKMGVMPDLSEQAVTILKEFYLSNAENLILLEYNQGRALRVGYNKTLKLQEERFMLDDLATLRAYRFIEYDSEDKNLYLLTRLGQQFIKLHIGEH